VSALARFDDWLNPIAVKELRQAVRGKFVMVALILSLLAELVAVAAITIASHFSSTDTPVAAGPGAFTMMFGVVFTAAIFFIPMYSGFRMAAERADANVDLLFITTIRPRTIVLGKVITVIGLVALLFSASLPFLMFSYVLRGVDFTTIVFLVAFAMLLVISQSIMALFIGCLPSSRPFKILLALGFLFGTFGVLVPMLAFAAEMVRSGGSMFFNVPRVWSGMVAGLVALGAVDAMLLVLMTAIITPAAANRALPIRIMLSVLWLLSLGAVVWAVVSSRLYDALQVWAVAQLALITLVLLSSTSERERWGPRVARTIPRNPLRRAIAFLFYSGAAGGTLWAMLMYVLTIIAYYLVFTNATAIVTRPATMTRYLIDASLAMIGYAMTAVLLRRKAFRRVPAARTWGLVLVLFMALTILPPLTIIAGDAESPNWDVLVHVTTIANPFPAAERSVPFRQQRTLCLALWAFGTVVANAPWFLAQMRAFGLRRPGPPLPEAVTES
jgi:hypothetical protein